MKYAANLILKEYQGQVRGWADCSDTNSDHDCMSLLARVDSLREDAVDGSHPAQSLDVLNPVPSRHSGSMDRCFLRGTRLLAGSERCEQRREHGCSQES